MAEQSSSLEERLAGLDGPLPLPAGLRRRLEDALLAGAPDTAGEDNPLAGLDRPMPLPAGLRRRLDETLVRRDNRRRVAVPSYLAIAAAVLLVLGSVTAIVRASSGPHRGHASVAAGSPSNTGTSAGDGTTTTSATSSSAAMAGSTMAATAAPGSGASGSSAGSPSGAASGAAGAAAAPAARNGPPPPFSFGTGNPGARSPTRSPLRIGVVGGDAAQEAGFRAYIDLLNRSGGAGGHALQAVPTSAAAPAADTVVTVNLSGAQIATTAGSPAWVRGALLETLPVASPVLTGNVFDLASPVERQAHLIVDSLYPDNAPGRTAAIYQAAAGTFGVETPQALDEALRSRQVTPVHVVLMPGQPIAFVGADAAFLSLDTAAASGWLVQAKSAGYAPARGVAGVSSLLDASLLRDLPDGARVLSPYLLPSGTEATAMTSGTGRAPSDAVTHGWVTGKALAVAVWQTDASTPEGVIAALRGLQGFDDGFAPPYATRPGGNARIPDGLQYRVAAGQFVQVGGFLTDPR
jgi:hypothetical protein